MRQNRRRIRHEHFPKVSFRKLQEVEAARQTSERQLQAFFDGAIDAMLIADDQGNYIEVNPAACELFGLSREELLGRNIADFTEVEFDFAQAWRSFLTQKRATGEFRLLRPDGILKEVEYAATANFLPHRHLSVLRDISRRKQAEAEIRLLNAELERRVLVRTAELSRVNQELANEIVERQRVEAALKASEAKLTNILNTVNAVIISIRIFANRDWRSEYYSSGCEQIFGYSAQELVVDKNLWLSRVLPEDLETVILPGFEAVFAERSTLLEYRFRHKDGTVRWISEALSSQQDEAADCWILNAVAIDITERKRMEEALRQSAAKLEIVVKSIPVMIYRYVHTVNGVHAFTYVSSGSHDLFELAPETLLQDASFLWALIHPDDRPSFQAAVTASASHLQPWQWEGRFITPSGQLKWIQGNARAVQSTEEDVWDGVLIDITAYKQTEAALRHSEAFNRQILDSSDDCIKVLDLAGRILYMNPGGQAALHMTDPKQFLNRSWLELWHDDDRQAILDAIATAKAGGVGIAQGCCPTTTGESKWWDNKMTAIKGADGQVERLLCISRDTTERRQIKELERLNQLKDDFLSTVSHELRSPITNIKMAIQMLRMAPTPERSQRYLEILQAECDRETALINDLLDLQRLEMSSDSVAIKDTVRLQEWLPRLIEPFQSRAQEQQQTLQIDLPPKSLLLITNLSSLERILIELLNNACKYTPANGAIVLSVRYTQSSLETHSDSTPMVVFAVSNQAEIAAAELPHIFEKFYRIPNADPWKQGGTGLGLALVQKLVEQLQGTIQVESSQGWTTFRIELEQFDELLA